MPSVPPTVRVPALACLVLASAGEPRPALRPPGPPSPQSDAPSAEPSLDGPAQDAPEVPELVLDADDRTVAASCTVTVGADWIEDTAEDGVLLVTGDEVVVDFAGAVLRGAPPGTSPDALRGIGVVVTGHQVTLRNARFEGFRCAVLARGTTGLTLEGIEVDHGFRQRLGSTRMAEDPADWLEPHVNDGNEWLERYGAAVWIEASSGATVRDVRVRRCQNGIVLDEVLDSYVYDCDASFLSGWGLALWRSRRNTVTRNAFDFCVRGYSHGLYNRGQDSAGILMFEQCNRNVISENSVTHGGDGIFVFAGREALGQVPPPDEGFSYEGRGCNGNVFHANDLSYAAAHGLELTFSFRNEVFDNDFVGNAICGYWGGYSHQTRLRANRFAENGEMGYGLESGGIAIEHGRRNVISHNEFEDNTYGAQLWWDDDPHLEETPWARANGVQCIANLVFRNSFDGEETAIWIRNAPGNHVDRNVHRRVGLLLDHTADSAPGLRVPPSPPPLVPPTVDQRGVTEPIGRRAHLAGREHIVMTEWGPWDHDSPYLEPFDRRSDGDEYRLHGVPRGFEAAVRGDVELTVDRASEPASLTVTPLRPGALVPYELEIAGAGLSRSELLFGAKWIAWFFPWETDPRGDLDAWHAEARERHVTAELPALSLAFGSGGPSRVRLAGPELRGADLPADRFGTIATSKVRFPAGRWHLVTRSDDGIRLWADGELLIDDWTHHAARTHAALLALDEPRSVDLRVEHFELDGHALLDLRVERAD